MTPENLEPNYARLFHEATAKEGMCIKQHFPNLSML